MFLICIDMNYIVEEIIRTQDDDSLQLIYPFQDYDHALKTVKVCADQMSEDDTLSFLAIDDEGNTFNLPIFEKVS